MKAIVIDIKNRKKIFSCRVKDQLLLGEFVERTENYIRVRIGFPFTNWECETTDDENSKFGLSSSNDYLTRAGEDIAREMLKDAFKKLVFIDWNIKEFATYYANFRVSVSKLEQNDNIKRRKRIIKKYKEIFFNDILELSDLGCYLPANELKQLENIMSTYVDNEEKIYLKVEEIDMNKIKELNLTKKWS